MARPRNFDRQAHLAQILATPPELCGNPHHYEMIEYSVSDIGDSIMVARAYIPRGSKGGVTYRQCWIIGPRGGRKTVYDRCDV